MAADALNASSGTYSRALAPRPPNSELLPEATRYGEDASNQRRTPKRRKIACKSCRQAKLRCEGFDAGKRRCQRCHELSLFCAVDTDYHRNSRRTGTWGFFRQAKSPQTIDDQLQTRQVVAPEPYHGNQVEPSNLEDPASSHVVVPTTSEISGSPPQPIPTPTASGAKVLETHDARVASFDWPKQRFTAQISRTINALTMHPAKIQHFFDIYFSQYNPSVPIVSPPASADVVYEASPLLFWTIIITAARHDKDDLSLLESLVSGVRELLWSTIAKPPYILPSLQAMCILCVWPLPASSWSQDIAFVLGGVLKSAALQTGLHRPEVFAHFNRLNYVFTPVEVSVAARVWCCVYIAIESVAMMMGQQPYLSTDRTVKHASALSNPYQLSETLHHAVRIQVFRNTVHSAMSDIDEEGDSICGPRRHSLLSSLEIDLQGLENSFEKSISYRTRAELLSACLQLRGYWLLERQESSSRRERLIQAYDTAIDLVTHVESGDNTGYPLKHLTLSLSMVCFAAGVLVSKVIHSNYRQHVDVERGTKAFNICIYIFRQCSVEDNDMPGRASRILAQLWGVHRGSTQDCLQPPRLNIVTRMFFSIVHDSLWLWRSKYGGQGAPPPPPSFIPHSLSEECRAAPISPATSATQSELAIPGKEPHRNSATDRVSSGIDLNGFVPNIMADMDFPGAQSGGISSAWEDWLLQESMAYDGPLPQLNARVDDLLDIR